MEEGKFGMNHAGTHREMEMLNILDAYWQGSFLCDNSVSIVMYFISFCSTSLYLN